MRLLVTGREGQLARSLAERAFAYPMIELHWASRPQCDLAIEGSAAASIARIRPDLVINAAAFTAVDLAEREAGLAHRINADGAAEIGLASAKIGAPVIQLSTDYVFGGDQAGPHDESVPIAPCNIYGLSKAEGEARIRLSQPDHLILRTSWLVAPFGRNFISTMLRLARAQPEIDVVADQLGCPTSALDLADAILAVADRRLSGDRTGWGATYHVAGEDSCSWADLAKEAMGASARSDGPSAVINPVSSADRASPAARPGDSRLDSHRFEETFGIRFPGYRKFIPGIVARLLAA